MGRLAVKPKLVHDAVMPRVRDLARQGLTQEKIAVEIGCSQGTIQKWLAKEGMRDESPRTGRLADHA